MKAGVQTTADPALACALDTLAEVAGRLGAAEVAEQVAEAAGRLTALVLEVAVVGEFKRGKSSLINALLDRQVLPVGVLPLTAVPTVLERGQEGLLVEYADGRREQHPLDRIARFVTEDANPANTLGVARVTARLHAPLLDEGVRLVDTPGVGSVLDHNTLATDAYLPSLDAAVLVTATDPPISKAERAFLERVAEHAVRLFVVLNKADYLAPDDLERTVAFTQRVVRQAVPGWPGPVYPLSARPGPAPATPAACGASTRTWRASCARSAPTPSPTRPPGRRSGRCGRCGWPWTWNAGPPPSPLRNWRPGVRALAASSSGWPTTPPTTRPCCRPRCAAGWRRWTRW
jgi:GTP-binding protein EngB required for normal cell division